MTDKVDHKNLHREARWLRRSNKSLLVIAAICLGLAASSFWYAGNAWETSVRMMAANSQLFATVQYERAEAGKQAGEAYAAELKLSEMEKRAQRAEGNWGYWKRTANDRLVKIKDLKSEVCQLGEIARANGIRLIRRKEC
tara:strand:- start:1203 stop:1622 length:420 start_codon:yes stop_codon:yes gene_type:complete